MLRGENVNHTKIGYYAELYVYPFVIGGLLLYDVDGSSMGCTMRIQVTSLDHRFGSAQRFLLHSVSFSRGFGTSRLPWE
jgi:hypothetical protein